MQSLDIGLFLAVFANLATATAEVRRFRACVPVINYAAVAPGGVPHRTVHSAGTQAWIDPVSLV